MVRLQSVLTLAEQKLTQTQEGESLVKETRCQLFETSRSLLEEIACTILEGNVISTHSDFITKTNEREVVLTLDVNLDERFC